MIIKTDFIMISSYLVCISVSECIIEGEWESYFLSF